MREFKAGSRPAMSGSITGTFETEGMQALLGTLIPQQTFMWFPSGRRMFARYVTWQGTVAPASSVNDDGNVTVSYDIQSSSPPEYHRLWPWTWARIVVVPKARSWRRERQEAAGG